MKIYTGTGDDGSTGLFGGARVEKDALRVDAYGTVDETSSALGLARALGVPAAVDAILATLQSDFFALGAELACVPGKEDKLGVPLLDAAAIAQIEAWIDEHDAELPPLRSFIVPGGTPGAGALHVARTTCRRAERRVVTLAREGGVRTDLLVYLNRVNDLLFVLARRANHMAGVTDVPWEPRRARHG